MKGLQRGSLECGSGFLTQQIKDSSLNWSFLFAVVRSPTYLPVKVCFNIHKENNTVNKAIPIDATSAIIATFSSHENQFEQNNKWENRSTVFCAGKGFFAGAFLLESHMTFFSLI